MNLRAPSVDLFRLVLVVSALVLGLTSVASAQGVATLRTPSPDTAETAPPDERLDDQEALLGFAACMRDNDIDFPNPRFGVGGGAFSPETFASIDFGSSAFLDAIEACESFLAALQPDLDAQEQAAQVEQQVAFAQCLRSHGIDFPDPDPVRGFNFGSFRGDDGGLAFDPFSDEFLSTIENGPK